ncbi:hypothetical protein DMUE_3671 [Dictyocoela muelleri]|nr:hypothetical protein DMUE_3671 [Dictyocoela muelleri]
MSRLSITGTSEDYLINIKRITKKLIEKHNIAQKKDLGNNPDQKIINDLYYALCGLTTTYIQIYDDHIEITPEYKKPMLLKLFEPLILNYLNLNNFVYQSEYSSDFMRRELAKIVDQKVGNYLKTVARNQGSSIENLYVALQPFIYEFEEFGILIGECSVLFGINLLNHLINRRNKTVSFNFYSEIINNCLKRYELEIGTFIFLGNISTDDFMIIKKNSFDFDESLWYDGHKINKNALPEKFVQDSKNILEAGKIANIINKIEHRNKETYRLKMKRIESYYEQVCRNNKKYLTNSKDKNNQKDDSEISYGLTNIVDLNSKDFLKKFKFSSKALKIYLDEQRAYFNEIILPSLEKEWKIIKIFILQTDPSFIYEFFGDIGDNLFSNDLTLLKKIKTPQQIELFLSELTLSSHLRRILSMRNDKLMCEKLCIFNSLSIKYKPGEIFKIFFPQKTLSELELIFRFFFTLNSINYRFSRLEKNKFVDIVLNFNNYLLTSLFIPTIVEQLDFKFDSFDKFIKNLNLLCRKCLRDLFLTSQRIFEVFSEYFELCLLQSDFLDFDENRILKIIRRLYVEIEKENGNLFLILQLERFNEKQ